jgi:hypothetical protein
MKWVPVHYTPGNENDIVDLMQQDIRARNSKMVFNHSLWKWKYRNNNAGFFPNWIFLAKSTEDEQICGHYTSIPLWICCNGKKKLAAQSVDILTHAKFRKQGIFTSLAGLCYDETNKNNVDVKICYPNNNSFPGFVKKLDWKHIFTVEERVFVLNVRKTVRAKLKNTAFRIAGSAILSIWSGINSSKLLLKANPETETKEISTDQIDYDLISKWLNICFSYFVDRSKEYFLWRYDQNPVDKDFIVKSVSIKGTIVGYYILKIKKYPHRGELLIGHIMEFLYDPENSSVKKEMIKDILLNGKKYKLDLIHAYTHKDQPDYSAYRSSGFLKADHKNYIIRLNDNSINYPEITNPKKWFIALGDSDRA